jgi:general secretion pathway protein F
LALAAAIAALIAAVRSRALRLRMGALVTRAPFVGERLKTYRLTRLYRTVAMLLHGGVPLLSSLSMVSGLLDPSSRQRLEHAMREVREGGTLSAALQRNALTTVIAQRMLEVGERSGNLGGLMEQAAQFHEDELARWVERATRMLEPMLMLLMGLLIGAIVVLMYLPIFDLAGTLQ